ncbi:Putative uncharacterized protein [Moritella viscosa]|uniref:hypothetical protein n=1 Tax=Moritella viscosa TaxID=80854 RepID=UPI000920F92A|nr:hypothetical protein [Moritella viscosa]SGZ07739.1 Putative uncharacterized protein [Moritella viscosa]
MSTLANLEKKDSDALLTLKGQQGYESLRTSAVQRAFGWGFNRTQRTIERAVKNGVLKENFDRGFSSHFTFKI